MKNKRIIYAIVASVIMIGVIIIVVIKNKNPELKENTVYEPKTIIEQILATNPDKKYLKLIKVSMR